MQERDKKIFRSYRPERIFRDWEAHEFKDAMQNPKRRLLMAVVQNNLKIVKELLKPEHFHVTDKNGLSLLHVAILQNSKNVFDYILRFPEYPLELVSDYGETPLITSILVIDNDQYSDYFAIELIKRNADIFFREKFQYTTLCCAALKHHLGMAEIFITKGVDLDAQDSCGNTALHLAADSQSPNAFAFISFLLYKGANPHILNDEGLCPFESFAKNFNDSLVLEVVFNYTYDRHSKMELDVDAAFGLALSRSDLLTKFDSIVYGNYFGRQDHLFYLDEEFLEIVLTKFPSDLVKVIQNGVLQNWSPNVTTLEKLQLLINCGFENDLIICIEDTHSRLVLSELLDLGYDEDIITGILCFLMTYGLEIQESTVQTTYRNFGNCELFQIFLHLNIILEAELDNIIKRAVFPTFLYNVNFDLEQYFQNIQRYSKENVDILLNYFLNRELKKLCVQFYGNSVLDKILILPDVPRLVELSRNVFRKFLISSYSVHNCAVFYKLVNTLDISDVYKKIITFEQELY